MEQFSKALVVGNENRLFLFRKIENTNGVKFFITSEDDNQKPIAFNLKQNPHGTNWKLVPGSLRWLYQIEEALSDAIEETIA